MYYLSGTGGYCFILRWADAACACLALKVSPAMEKDGLLTLCWPASWISTLVFLCTHQVAALFRKWHHGCHLASMTSYRKFITRCTFSYRTILPSFIPILFETVEPRLFWKRSSQRKNNNKNKTRSNFWINSWSKNVHYNSVSSVCATGS